MQIYVHEAKTSRLGLQKMHFNHQRFSDQSVIVSTCVQCKIHHLETTGTINFMEQLLMKESFFGRLTRENAFAECFSVNNSLDIKYFKLGLIRGDHLEACYGASSGSAHCLAAIHLITQVNVCV